MTAYHPRRPGQLRLICALKPYDSYTMRHVSMATRIH
jgi:hypothetical protein